MAKAKGASGRGRGRPPKAKKDGEATVKKVVKETGDKKKRGRPPGKKAEVKPKAPVRRAKKEEKEADVSEGENNVDNSGDEQSE